MESQNAAALAKQLQTVDLTADTPPRSANKVTPPPAGGVHKSYKATNEPRVKMWEPPLSTINNQAQRTFGAGPSAPLGMTGYNSQHSQPNSQSSSSPLPPAYQPFSAPGPSAKAAPAYPGAAVAAASSSFVPLGSSSPSGPGFEVPGGYISAADRDAALTASIDAMMAQATELADVDMSEADVPGLKCRLLPHQVQGHAWMQKREKGEYAGGILADDMGLGKTVQMLALVVSSKAAARAEKKAAATKSSRSDIVLTSQQADMEKCRKSRTTLIVAPLAVVRQWEREAIEKTDALKVYVHHGNARAKSSAIFSKYDLVVTTYTTAAAEYKNVLPGAPTVKKSKSKSASFNSDSDDDSSDEDAPIVVESDSDSDGPVRPGQSKIKKKPTAPPRKVIRRPAKPAPLFEYDWRRIVLDEAQTIKNHKAQCSQAACALSERAFAKWCLTGTPIQNNCYEMYSLIHFLRIPPFNDYKHFKEKIGEPLKSTNQNRVNWGMKRLCVVLQTIMLRRTKDAQHEGKAILQLPNRSIEIVESDFDDPEERAFYDTLEGRIQKNVRKNEREGVKVNHIQTLCMLLRLRQACNHIGLVASKIESDDAIAPVSDKKKSSGKGKSVSVETGTDSDGSEEEDELGDELADLMANMAVKTKPCTRCQVDLPASEAPDVCEACATDAQKTTDWNAKGRESTKIRMMIKLLGELRSDEKTKGQKTIIFSQFTSFLDLIEPSLRKNKFRFVRYDGSMRQEHREDALEAIRSDPAITVILISFKAGSTGLNLTCCNNVILCDLWWNPALEMQAFDRAYRLGQTRDVRIHKLVISNSVEQRILTLQEKKSALSKAALEGSKLSKNNNKLTKDELRYLFSGHN